MTCELRRVTSWADLGLNGAPCNCRDCLDGKPHQDRLNNPFRNREIGRYSEEQQHRHALKWNEGFWEQPLIDAVGDLNDDPMDHITPNDFIIFTPEEF